MAAPAVCPHCGAVERDHHADLSKRIYLTVAQLQEYLGFTTPKTRHFLERHASVRRVRVGKYLLVWRRDVDEELASEAATQAERRIA